MGEGHEFRWGGVAGIGVVLLAIIAFLIMGSPPTIMDSPGSIAAFLSDHRSQILTGALLYAVAIVLALWFGAALATAPSTGAAKLVTRWYMHTAQRSTTQAHGDPAAVLTLDVYTHRLDSIGAMSTATGALDALVFTGGVGAHSATMRRRAVERLGFLGVAIDIHRNTTVHDDCDITAAAATVRTLVITAREDLQAAREACRRLATTSAWRDR